MRLLSRDLDGKWRIYDDHRDDAVLTKINKRIQDILNKGENRDDDATHNDHISQRNGETQPDDH